MRPSSARTLLIRRQALRPRRASDQATSAVPPGGKRSGEVVMFEMLNEEKPDAEARRMFWLKVGFFVVALGALGGVIYFFGFLPYSH